MADETRSSPGVRKPRVLLLYPYYWPFYKAGGPVQSIFNIAATFTTEAEFFIIALNRDIDSSETNTSLEINRWTTGPNGEHIYFVDAISPFAVKRLLGEVDPDTVFINGIFNGNTTLPGLFWSKVLGKKVVISPRGMLQKWALNRHSVKKNLYLKILALGINGDVEWHATDHHEANDILRVFGGNRKIHVASNIPRKVNNLRELDFPISEGRIRLVFLSLINPNKNLHLIIDAVKALASRYELDIYGPVIDKGYWEFCQSKIDRCEQIQYQGPVPPWKVPDLLAQYHFFVLPTQGENFGHAIFDSLASGVPVIISRNTPWKDIDIEQAGFYIDQNDSGSLRELLGKISLLSATDYNSIRQGSLAYAAEFWNQKNYLNEYGFLFGQV